MCICMCVCACVLLCVCCAFLNLGPKWLGGLVIIQAKTQDTRSMEARAQEKLPRRRNLKRCISKSKGNEGVVFKQAGAQETLECLMNIARVAAGATQAPLTTHCLL